MKGQILVADDDPILRELYVQALLDAGHEVETASDVASALGRLAKKTFDVVVSDIMMPGGSGVDLLRAAHLRDPDLPVILVTGSPSLETAIEALGQGALAYLRKPVLIADLHAAVSRALRLRRMATLKREALAYLTTHTRLNGDSLALNQNLTSALGSLWMAFQPIVNAADGRVFGYEALMRTAQRSLPNPGAILEAAERLGRVTELGRTVRDAVARSVISDMGNTFVNLHALELTDESLFSPDSPLSKKASGVILEITERAALDGIPDARTRIRALRDMGFRIAVDDLGAGYAGLQSFAQLEPDIVKLDMSLVRGVDSEPVKQRLVASMTSLCKDLGIRVVAEGIETAAERDMVVELGCDLLQGYLLGRPAEAPIVQAPKTFGEATAALAASFRMDSRHSLRAASPSPA